MAVLLEEFSRVLAAVEAGRWAGWSAPGLGA
jgi:hypothetical protein